ncbi:hypothetical protein K458DRAFT_395638 [Lentithecium fluviatile CBS 122367]|uniref:Uncharacterized protein n=1 Tax=Lentithecium fluviatile CBS 122367 TaxID=1168545 RepID=A0A6G1IHK8_9PLEO|nr:hypothetical protein K458DRAFT_395638 [Lentithecium fluviatile CBS 122367]
MKGRFNLNHGRQNTSQPRTEANPEKYTVSCYQANSFAYNELKVKLVNTLVPSTTSTTATLTILTVSSQPLTAPERIACYLLSEIFLNTEVFDFIPQGIARGLRNLSLHLKSLTSFLVRVYPVLHLESSRDRQRADGLWRRVRLQQDQRKAHECTC